jgi:hypothetical protein
MSLPTTWISTLLHGACLSSAPAFEDSLIFLPSSHRRLEDYLQTWPSTLFVVSHDRAFLDAVATDIIHQHNERLDYYKGSSRTARLVMLRSLTPGRP